MFGGWKSISHLAYNVLQISEGKDLETKILIKKQNIIMKTKTSIYHLTFAYVPLVAVFSFFKKMFTHNYCDICGFTKDKVYLTEICMEAGIIQCDKCIVQNCH